MGITRFSGRFGILFLAGALAACERGGSDPASLARSQARLEAVVDALRLPRERLVVFDARGDRVLVGLVAELPPEISVPVRRHSLIEIDLGGPTARRLGEDVGYAAFISRERIALTRHGGLYLFGGPSEDPLLPRVDDDFAVAPAGDLLAVVRDFDGMGQSEIDLFQLETRTTQPLVRSPGRDDRPFFIPGGGRLLFVSSRTGLASFHAIDLATGETRQLTNAGLRGGGGLLPPDFVPPPDSRGTAFFSADRRFVYDAGGRDLWSLDLATGAAAPLGRAR